MAVVGLDSTVYENVLANMDDGVIAVDHTGRIMTCNPAGGRILAIDPRQTIGRTFHEVFLIDAALEPLSDLLLKAIYEAETTHTQEIALRIGGQERYVFASTTFLADGSGEKGVIVVLSDVTERIRRQKVQALFGEYVDPRIVERLLAQGSAVGERGKSQLATVMFTDLQGFTRLSDILGPERMIVFLNRFLTLMTEPIAATDGVTDKYIGDSVMAFWTAPFVDEAEIATRACQAALAQRRQLTEVRRAALEAVQGSADVAPDQIDIRTGIATGLTMTGNVGTDHTRNFTVIGPPVNVAARLEAANKELGTRILVAQGTYERAGDNFAFDEHPAMHLRGRLAAERVFELRDTAG